VPGLYIAIAFVSAFVIVVGGRDRLPASLAIVGACVVLLAIHSAVHHPLI